MSAELTLRREIVAQAAKLAASGLSQGTSDNLSTRSGTGFLITPSGTPYEGMALQVGKPVMLTDPEVTEVLEKFARYGLMSVKTP